MSLFAVIGDVHAHFGNLDRVLERVARERVDAVLLVGDLGSHHLSLARLRSASRDRKYLESVGDVLHRCQQLGVPVRYVPGNHDLPELCFEGNLDGRSEQIAGLRVAGIGGAGPARFGFPYEWSEDALRARKIPEADVLLVHAPPRDTPIDLVPSRNLHAGSAAMRERALATDGFLVCGHIHESPGAVQIGRCLCLNAGGLGKPYGRPQVGFLRRTARGDCVGLVQLDETDEIRWWWRT